MQAATPLTGSAPMEMECPGKASSLREGLAATPAIGACSRRHSRGPVRVLLERYRTMESAMLAAAQGFALDWMNASLREPD